MSEIDENATLVELDEIADGAYGNNPMVRGLARDRAAELRAVSPIDKVANSLSLSQRAALIGAFPREGGGWRVSERDRGFRGLPKLSLAYGRAYANRAPGTLGMLTELGIAVRDSLINRKTKS